MLPGLVDWSFIVTLVVILLATLVGSYIRSNHRDRCLKDFDGFHITVERKDNRVMWGEMDLYPTGFELIYRSDVLDDKHLETSYIFYKDEYQDLQAIYRYARNLTEEKRKQRAKDLQRSFHPGIGRRLWRSTRNFLSTASDSLSEGLGVVIGRTRKPATTMISETSEVYLKDMSRSLIGYVGTSYDTLLEAYVGSRVVMEVVEDNEIHEHVGVLKEYSANFLELLDVFFPLPQKVAVGSDAHSDVINQVHVTAADQQIRVRNDGLHPVYVDRISLGDVEKPMDAIVAGGEEIILNVEHSEQKTTLHLRVACRLDMILPRSHALIRHRAERYDPDTIFDIGLSLVRREGDEKEITRLQQVLRYSPHDAISAAHLGELFYRSGQLVNAEKWLAVAQRYRHHLPDNGNRVDQNLRMLHRRIQTVAGAGKTTEDPLSLSEDGQDPTFEIQPLQETAPPE
ncbi:MAG: hypothetical protein U9R25_04355 [Chloroflexota bacterium]|nr:hypothetical protein [Chloroflexota bacterium]